MWVRLNEMVVKADTAILLAAFLVTFILYVKRHKPTSKRGFTSSLPGVKWTWVKLPLIDGFITQYKTRKYGLEVLEQLTHKYGSIFRLPVPFTEFIAVSDLNVIQRVLFSTDGGHLGKPQLFQVVFPPCINDGILLADAGPWSAHRKAVSKAFSYNAYPTYLKYIQNEARELVRTAVSTASSVVDSSEMIKLVDRHAVKIILHVIMGSESCCISEEERDQFHENFLIMRELLVNRFIRPELTIPPIWMMHPRRPEWERVLKENDQLARKIVNRYRTKEQDANTHNGIQEQKQNIPYQKENMIHNGRDDQREVNEKFQCLVERMIKGDLNDKEIADDVVTFLVVGHETVVNSMNFLLFHLASNTECQEKCRIEVDTLFDGFQTDLYSVAMEDLSKLKYLERCILESLRITSTVPTFLRRLDASLEIADGCVIDAGEQVLIMPWVVHRNPDIYPNPMEFIPDRFLPENVKARHSHAFIPFSMGMRNCVGWKLALMEMKVMVAYVLRYFELSTSDDLCDYRMHFGITIKAEKPFNVMYKIRSMK